MPHPADSPLAGTGVGAIRRINAPHDIGSDQAPVTSAFIKEALNQDARLFNWEEKKKLSGQRTGNKVIGIGIGQGYNNAGTSGFDGLLRITPDGKLHGAFWRGKSRHLLALGDEPGRCRIPFDL